MPAPLDAPSVKKDIRLFTADVELLEPLLRTATNNTNLNEWVRNLVHREANSIRAQIAAKARPQ